MPSYRCLIEGRNFLVCINGEKSKQGFYKTVFVNSANPEQAELDAVQLIRESDLRDLVKNDRSDPPMLFLDEIEEIEEQEIENYSPGGATWYPDEGQE